MNRDVLLHRAPRSLKGSRREDGLGSVAGQLERAAVDLVERERRADAIELQRAAGVEDVEAEASVRVPRVELHTRTRCETSTTCRSDASARQPLCLSSRSYASVLFDTISTTAAGLVTTSVVPGRRLERSTREDRIRVDEAVTRKRDPLFGRERDASLALDLAFETCKHARGEWLRLGDPPATAKTSPRT